ncbi:type II secretion system protein GspG [Aquabacterium lacunae]|uniref:Type II secretion system core protein G n=1 Tax=Aquabacterium lacunae TaxID=2528630 RepID=A0A4Q9GXV4_9BURK|nr:type II secretion system major pseudopilin GspG [Aquabacterium lacunae]TBO30453.1 type II secretion system protein GspG [Aquabacterium lacunae]
MRRASGFTLLELLVVMVIIGLLASFVAPRYFGQVGKSEVKAARAQLQAFQKALDTYRLDVGAYPTTAQGLRALVEAPPGLPRWSGPYLQNAVPPDPWGQAYRYSQPGKDRTAEYDLWSTGADRAPGGTGEAADLSIWATPAP